MTIKIPHVLYSRMIQYARLAEKHFGSEIAGWGHWQPQRGIYKLAPLPKQEVSGAEVDAFPDFTDFTYDISDMVVQWHSHVKMACKPSSTDDKNVKLLMQNLPIAISIIVNVYGDYTARVNVSKTSYLGQLVALDDIYEEEVVLDFFDDNDIDKLEQEVLSKCSKPIPVQTRRIGYGWENNYDDYYGYSPSLFDGKGNEIPKNDGKIESVSGMSMEQMADFLADTKSHLKTIYHSGGTGISLHYEGLRSPLVIRVGGVIWHEGKQISLTDAIDLIPDKLVTKK